MKKRLFQALALVAGIAAGSGIRIASAQGTSGSSFNDLVNSVGNRVSNLVFPMIVAVAVLAFIWNMIRFIVSAGSEAERTKFKKYSVNALIALFILFCLWGIIGIFTRTFFGSGPFIPQLPTCDGTATAPC